VRGARSPVPVRYKAVLPMADAPLSDLALARLYGGRAVDDASLADAALGSALRKLHDEGAQAFPGVRLDVEVFVSHLAVHAAAGLPSAGRGPDLYLACACATRVRGAVEAFERAYLVGIGAHLARLGPTAAFVDEVRQEVRSRLFVGPDGAALRIAGYDGCGALASWVRVIALREALDLRRRRGVVDEGDEERAQEVKAAGDPERDYQKAHYQRAFDAALQGAVAALDKDQRRILRRHFADGITLDALAVELGVHRATVARHLAAARAALRSEVRRRLQAALGGADSDLGSLARTMRSRLDLSLPGLLRSTDPGPEPG
jgi:RNA polymerase sigma-70 factor (ECF subfamily)